MAKMTDAQKEERRVQREETKRIEAQTQRNVAIAQRREFDIKAERARHLPSPTRWFKVDDMVQYGNHHNTRILEVFDGGKFYEVYNWGIIEKGTQGAGNSTNSTTITPWIDLYVITSIPVDKLFKRNIYQLNYSQQGIDSLLHKVYGYGVDFDADYQRELEWSDEDKTSLIDSIMTSRDIGKFLFMELDYDDTGVSDQIIDGKQRLTTICEFYEDRFVWRGLKFSELSYSDRRCFEHKNVNVAQVNQMPRETILELFLFVNDTGKSIAASHIDKVKGMLAEVRTQAEVTT
jgi:hypothetical protein